MKSWQVVRRPILGITLGGVFLVMVKILLVPGIEKPAAKAFEFPGTVPLAGWQSLPSESLGSPPLLTEEEESEESLQYISGRRYRYEQNKIPLEVEMRYLVKTDGDVRRYLREYAEISLPPVGDPKTEEGAYKIFVYENKAYLSACINPRGGSTVTARQFKQNRNIYDWEMSRLLPWFLGKVSLKDERCLWATLSIPLEKSVPKARVEATQKQLETVWVDWYEGWRSRFPKEE